MVRIVADAHIPFLKGVLEPHARVLYIPGSRISPIDIKDADALFIRTRTKCDKNLLSGSRVRFIASATIGADHIDTDYCNGNGIEWRNAPGCNAASVVQYTASAIAAIMQHSVHISRPLTLGIVGAGHIGSRIATMAGATGLKVLVNDPPRQAVEGDGAFCSLEELIRNSDIISLNLPLNREGPYKSFYLVNHEFIERMKPESWLINTSRGEIADTDALLQALHKRRIQGVVADVWENEPAINLELLKQVFIGTPHIAGYSTDGKAMGTAMIVREASRYFGFGIDDWFPENLPPPPRPEIITAMPGMGIPEIFADLSLKAYDIFQDSLALKNAPARFEEFRNKYPVRREPGALLVSTQASNPLTDALLKHLGYGLARFRS